MEFVEANFFTHFFNLAAEGKKINKNTSLDVNARSRGWCNLQNGNVIVYLCAMLLCHALGDPDDVAALLFLQFQVRVEDTEVELLHESVDVQFDLK